MDVKYIPSDWEKMKDGIGDLIGLGRWGKGMIDDLKAITDNLEDAESDIASLDSDGVISFHHTSQKDKFQHLYEDFEVLHRFTGKVGDIVDRTIDQPFYEDIDAFVKAMRDLTISNYTTKNRVGATEVKVTYAGYGQQQTFEVPKTEVSIDDLFNGDNYYAEQIKLEYDAWKELNPDQDFSQKEYQLAAVNTHAFEYDSIRNQQESKEFWGQIAALVVIVGVSLVCPPAGIALGAAYGTFELSSAVSGKDWISGRELGTGERVFRGLLSPLDIIPGVSSITKFSGAVKLAHLGDMGQFAVKTGIKSSIKDGVTHIGNMVETAGKVSATRLKSAASAIKDGGTAIKNKVVEDTKDIGKLVGTEINNMTNIIPSRKLGLAADGMGDVGHAHIPVDEARVVGNEKGDVVSRIDGVNLSGGKNIDTLVDDLLKKSTCNVDELTGYLKQIDKYNGTNYADEFVSLGKWPDDIQIPKDSKVLNADGSINWSEVPNGGYVLDKNGNAIKEVFVPKIGDIIDRYGPPNGRYTSPVMDGKPYDYGQRSLPYIEDVTKYHQYEVTGDFSRLKDYVMNCNDMKLKVKVEAQIERYYNGDYSKVIAQKGEIAKGFGSPGGGIQYELPIPVEWLEGLGMLREIK